MSATQLSQSVAPTARAIVSTDTFKHSPALGAALALLGV